MKTNALFLSILLIGSVLTIGSCSKDDDDDDDDKKTIVENEDETEEIKKYTCECDVNYNAGTTHETIYLESTPDKIQKACEDESTHTSFGKTCTYTEGW
ncbi:MAG: hypothetical protein R2813_11845 [Flavobacteriales bacterium]